jgi:hypothetical protein
MFQFEKTGHCRLLLVQGDDKFLVGDIVNKMVAVLNQHGLNNYTTFYYPGAGHLIEPEPPYTPVNRVVYHKLSRKSPKKY